MARLSDLVEILVTTPLRCLLTVDAAAGTARWRRLQASPADFHAAALAAHLQFAQTRLGCDGPWVWAHGDLHPGHIASLATGPRRGDEPPAALYDVCDADHEHPAPWSWDLLRCVGGLGVWTDEKPESLRRIAGVVVDRYREVLLRAAEGDGEHGGRVFLQDLPRAVVEVLERDGDDPDAEARWHRACIINGRHPRLRRDDEHADDPAATIVREQVQRWLTTRKAPLSTLDAVRLAPTGQAAGPVRTYLVLCRDGSSFRLLDVRERRPSELARVLPAHPFDARVANPATLTVVHGRDPWQTVLPSAPWPLLVRTRCHAHHPVDPASGSAADRLALAKLWAGLLANAHLRGLDRLGVAVPAAAEAIAADALRRRSELAALCAEVPRWNRDAWRTFRAETADLL